MTAVRARTKMGVFLTVFSVDVEMDIGSIVRSRPGRYQTRSQSRPIQMANLTLPKCSHIECRRPVSTPARPIGTSHAKRLSQAPGRKVLQSTQKPAIYSPAKHSNCLKSATSCRIWGEIRLQPSSKSRLLKSTVVINIGTAFQRSTVHDSQDCAAHVYDSPAAEVA